MKKALILTMVALTCSAFGQGPGAMTPHVRVDKVTTGKDLIMRRSIGHTEAIKAVRVTAAVEGHLLEPKFKEGHIVQRGDILFEINPVRYKAAVQKAAANVQEIEALIAYATVTYQRLKKLEASKLSSQQNLETALAELEELKARKAEAEAQLATAQKNLEDCTIRAEITGRIGRSSYTKGHYVTPGEELTTIRQMDPIYVRFPLSQSDVNGIFRGPMEIANVAVINLITATGRVYPHKGTISVVDNVLSGQTDSYTLWAEFPNKDSILTPDGIGALNIHLSDTAVVTMVPMTAVRYDSEGAYVYIVDEQNKVSRREVIAGNVQGRMQSIYSGVQEGEVVITDGSHKTRIGAKVTPVFSSAAENKTVTGNTHPEEEEPIVSQVATVTMESDTTVLTCNGARTEAITKVDVRPLVQGLMQEQAVEDGSIVKEGEVLFRIDTTRYQAAVDAQKARVAQLTIKIEDARKKLERQEFLVQQGASTHDERDSAEATYKQLCAQKTAAEAELIIAEDDLSRCTMRASMNARIGRVSMAEGNYFSDPQATITTLYQISPVYVRFALSENEVLTHFGSDEAMLKQADITLISATGKQFEEKGSVAFSDNNIKPATNTQNFWATFPNTQCKVRPGATVTVRITRKPEFKVAAVPAEAVLMDTRGRYVFVLKNGRAVMTRILCGKSTISGRIPVYAGLEEGDQVLTTNLAQMMDGSPVTPATPTSSQP